MTVPFGLYLSDILASVSEIPPSKSCRLQKKPRGQKYIKKEVVVVGREGSPPQPASGWVGVAVGEVLPLHPLSHPQAPEMGPGGAWARAMGDTLAGEVPYMLGGGGNSRPILAPLKLRSWKYICPFRQIGPMK